MSQRSNMHCGVAAIVGRANTGKSTLLNAIVGEKVSIVSPVAQTTRYNVRGIFTDERGQVVFIDTPGMHVPKSRMGQCLIRRIDDALSGCDCIVHLVDVTEAPGEEERFTVEKIAAARVPVILGLNKIDLKAVFLDTYIKMWEEAKGKKIVELCEEVILMPLSALRGTNVKELVSAIMAVLPEGMPLYPKETVTDQPQRLAIADIIREKLFKLMREEIPYSIAVYVDEFKERSKKLDYIQCVIIVERESQKAIIIGKDGSLLKEAGSQARIDLEGLLGKKVFLETHVKVKPHWQEDPATLRELGML